MLLLLGVSMTLKVATTADSMALSAINLESATGYSKDTRPVQEHGSCW